MFEKILERLWNTINSWFQCFKQPETIKYNNELEYGKLADFELLNTSVNANKITIKIPKYEFILIEE
jgi:hypothetical protein